MAKAKRKTTTKSKPAGLPRLAERFRYDDDFTKNDAGIWIDAALWLGGKFYVCGDEAELQADLQNMGRYGLWNAILAHLEAFPKAFAEALRERAANTKECAWTSFVPIVGKRARWVGRHVIEPKH